LAQMFTCEEVAERYKVKVITVWEWIRQKKLGAIKLGREYRITEDDLVAFEDSRRVKTE
jgi:excisionase family DNA binding protein